MNIPASQPLLNEIGTAMVQAAPDNWRRITLDITAAANMLDMGVDVELADGSHDHRVVLDDDADDTIAAVRSSMYQEGKGTWYNATLEVSDGGKLDATFDYDNPPFDGMADDPTNEGSAAPELLLEDHRMFPRDESNLPEWHPACRAKRT